MDRGCQESILHVYAHVGIYADCVYIWMYAHVGIWCRLQKLVYLCLLKVMFTSICFEFWVVTAIRLVKALGSHMASHMNRHSHLVLSLESHVPIQEFNRQTATVLLLTPSSLLKTPDNGHHGQNKRPLLRQFFLVSTKSAAFSRKQRNLWAGHGAAHRDSQHLEN